MATDYTKQSSDALIAIIKAAYPRFKHNNRIKKMMPVDGELRHIENHLGPEDLLFISPGDPSEETVLLLTRGEVADQTWHIIYYHPLKISNETEIMDKISSFAQNLLATLIDNKDHSSGYWINLRAQLSYGVDIPENYDGDLFGFEIVLQLTIGRF